MYQASYSLSHLTDSAVLEGLVRVSCDSRRALAQLLCHLAEVDHRKLYLAKGYSSLFTYVVEFLRFSENEAQKRIVAARAAREYPVIFELVAQGELHLTAVSLVARHLSPENHEARLAAARGKTKREVEELVAAWAPKPDAPSLLRRLPEPASLVLPAVPTAAPGAAAAPAALQAALAAVALEAPKAVQRPSVKPLSPGRYR